MEWWFAFVGVLLGATLAIGLITGVHPGFRKGPLPPRFWIPPWRRK